MSEENDVRRAIATVEMRAGLGLAQGEVQLGYGVDLGDAGPRIMAFYLHDFEVTQAYQAGGYASIVQYGEQRWDLDRRRTGELVRIGGKLRELPRIDEALCSRKIGWSKVVELAKVAVPEHEEAWLELALGLSYKDLKLEVKMASAGGKPRDRGDRKGLPELRFDVQCRVSATVREKLDLAREKLCAERGELFSDADLLEVMADLLLCSEEDGSVPGRNQVPASQYLLVLRPDAESGGMVLDGLQGQVPIGEVECACAICDGQVIAMRDSDGAREDMGALPHAGKSVGGEGLSQCREPGSLSALLSEDEAVILDRATPSWLRVRVLNRDGGRCRCCGNRRQVQVHHIQHRANAGQTRADNLICLCKTCHALTHTGLLLLVGEHEKDLVFVDAQGRALHDHRRRVNRDALVELKRFLARRFSGEPGFEAGEEADAETGEPGSLESRGRSGGLLVRLNNIPDEIDAHWWATHESLIRMRSGKGLEFREGYAQVVDPMGSDAAGAMLDREEVSAWKSQQVDRSSDCSVAPSVALLEKLIGREDVVERLRVEALGCARRGRPFPNMLLAGPPGTGKTTLAVGLAKAYGVRLHRAMGTMIQDVPALLRLITGLGEGDCLFLDEIHAMPRGVLETLYQVMEGGRLSLTLHCGNQSRCVSLRLPRLTVLAATTEPDELPPALVSRFGIVEHLPYYGCEELTRILLARAREEGVELAKRAAKRIAMCSRGTPREALRLMDSVFNQLAAKQEGVGHLARQGRGDAGTPGTATLGIGLAVSGGGFVLERVTLRKVIKVLERLGYDEEGLSELDQRYLELLQVQAGGPIALHRLAIGLGCPVGTVRDEIEPRLSSMGLVKFTPQGRVAVGKPVDHRPRPFDRLVGASSDLVLANADRVSETVAFSSAAWGWQERVPNSGRTGLAVVRGLRGLALPG